MAFNRSSLRRRPICAGSQIITAAPFIYGSLKNLEFTFYVKECNVKKSKENKVLFSFILVTTELFSEL